MVLLANAAYTRSRLLQRFMEQRRDIDTECNYPVGGYDAAQFQELFDKEAIANKVVRALPEECWQVQPTVYEDEDTDNPTQFEDDWDALGNGLRGEENWYKDEMGSPVWDYMQRLDIVSGIGRYGVGFLGFDDGLHPSQPLQPKKGRKLLFVRCFPEVQAQITQWESNPASRRYGQPNMYSLMTSTFGDNAAGLGQPVQSVSVHWTRIQHAADQRVGNEILAVPRCAPVLRRLLDLQKVYAAGAEGFWKSAFAGISFETHPQLGGDVDIDVDGLKDMVEDYYNGLQRALVGRGLAVKTISHSVNDPASLIDVLLTAVCIQLRYPKRIFMGSERGEANAQQDDDAWNDRLKQRQYTYITPHLIVPFVNRCIWAGALAAPSQFHCSWPDLTSQSAAQKADVASKRLGAIATYAGGDATKVMTPMDMYVRELGYSEEEATAILDNVEVAHAEAEAEPTEVTEGMLEDAA